MILKAKQRADPVSLGKYLVSDKQNDLVEVFQVKGFLSRDVVGAMQEVELASLGLRANAKQPVMSISLSPPKNVIAGDDVFERAMNAIEEKLGLSGQPRVAVFHEPRSGGRHLHVVWSRIDAEKNTLKHLPHYKLKLQEISRQLFLSEGWQLPKGLTSSKDRDPRNFTFEEYQAARRKGDDVRDLTDAAREAWSVSKTRQELSLELEKRGLFLAIGDSNRYVVMTAQQGIYSLPRLLGQRTKAVRERIGELDESYTLDAARARVAKVMTPALTRHMDEVRRVGAEKLQRLDALRVDMNLRHKKERALLDARQKTRADKEAQERAARLPRGLAAVFSWISGKYAAIRAANDREAFERLMRDRNQRNNLVVMQIAERDQLRAEIRDVKRASVRQLRQLHAASARLRQNALSIKAHQNPQNTYSLR